MSYFIVLGKEPDEPSWEYLGEEYVNSPEDAFNRVVDKDEISGDYRVRILPTMDDEDGGPFWYVRDDLDI